MIISRYLSKQVLQTTALISFILLVVAVLGRLLKYLAQASQGELDPGVLFLLMTYRLPDFLQLILPVALLLGILLAYGRMYAESEMTVLSACGVGAKRLLKTALLASSLIALLTAFLALYLTPRGLISAGELLEAQKNLNEFDVMVPGIFQNISQGARTTYAERVEGDTMHKVFMHDAAQNRVIVAEIAEPFEDEQGQRFVLFHNGSITEGMNRREGYTLTQFEKLGVSIPPRKINFDAAQEEQSMLNSELWESGAVAQIAELQWRISLILLIPVLTLLAVPMSEVSPREGRFAKLVPAILLYIIYFGLLLVSRDKLAHGAIPAWLGLWWVHLLFLLGGWGMYTGKLTTNMLRPGRHANS